MASSRPPVPRGCGGGPQPRRRPTDGQERSSISERTGAPRRSITHFFSSLGGGQKEKQSTMSKHHDERDEIHRKQRRTHTTTMSSKILEMAGRNPRSQTLSDPVWIKVSRVMDSGTAKSAAHIGRECVVHPHHTWWQATTGVHFGSLGFHTAESLAFPAFISSHIVSRSLVSIMVA